MTVNATTALSAPQTADGSNRTWYFPFKVVADNQIVLYLLDLDGVETRVTSGYSVVGVGSDNGGEVTYPLAPIPPLTAGTTVKVGRYVVYEQPDRLGNQGPYLPRIHEGAFDRLEMQIQQLAENVSRAPLTPIFTPPWSVTFPPSDPGHVLIWDENGDLANSETDIAAFETSAINAQAAAEIAMAMAASASDAAAAASGAAGAAVSVNASIYFDSRTAAAEAASLGGIPVNINIIRVASGAADDDGLQRQYVRGTEEVGSDWFEDLDGSYWVWAPEKTVIPLGYAARSKEERFGGHPHVEDWRGYGGDPSDTGMFQAAAALAPPGIVRMQGAGTGTGVSYNLEDTITVDRSHILFSGGAAAGLGHSTGSQEYTVNFNWTGDTGGTMWLFSPVAGPTNQNCHGGGLVSCRLLGNTVAAIGLQVISWCRGRFDIWGHNLTDWIMDMDVIPAGNLGDITAASFNDVWVFGRQNGADTGGVLRVGGDDDGNTCYNFFWQVVGTVSNGAIADIGNTDSNWFHLLRGNQVGGYATAGIILRGGHNALNACRGNFFNMVYPTSTANSFRSCGTDTFTDPISGAPTTYTHPAKGNQILWYDKGNSAPDPIIGTGSTLVWGNHTGAHSYASLLEDEPVPTVLPGTAAVYATGGDDLRVKFDSGTDVSLITGSAGAGRKSPVLDWTGREVLWLGTSIPAQGGAVDSYGVLASTFVGANCTNNSWGGSQARYDVTGDPMNIGTVNRLSMTQDDVVWGLATYGPTSAYDDDFHVTTKASEQTADFRIKAEFAATPTTSVVFLDHNHNDRTGTASPGTLTPETLTITAITKGATTTVTLSSIGAIVVGNAVALEVVGITKLNHAAARVQSVAGDVITLNINSSGYAGTFTSGTCIKLDRATIYGSFEFLIHYIKNMSLVYGDGTAEIILVGEASRYTSSAAEPGDDMVAAMWECIRALANKWGLAAFDLASSMQINSALDQPTYFEDGTHPLEVHQRQAIANHFSAWMQGGYPSGITGGTWTPTFAFVGVGDSVITYTTQVGRWMKIGGLVLIAMDLKFDTNAYTTASGGANIGGLPFMPTANGGSLSVGLMEHVAFTAGHRPALQVVPSLKAIRLQIIVTDAAAGIGGVTNFLPSKTGILIRATGSYWTDE